MEVTVKPTSESEVLEAKYRLGKMVIATVAGFIAKEGAEKFYDAALKRYQDKKTTKTQP